MACRTTRPGCAASRPWAFPTSAWRCWRCVRSALRAGWARPRRAARACCTMRCAPWPARPARMRCARCATSWASIPVFKRIDSCAAEFEAVTPYMYSTYEAPMFGEPENEAWPSDRRKIVILGGGPNRIGQGIEFDYCCVHACFALAEAGYETIMVNCNPETVSDRLRHLRPPLFRAADRRGRAGNPARRAVRTANWSA
jgi:hypothetical protein